MSLSSAWSLSLHNLFHPTAFFLLFLCLLLVTTAIVPVLGCAAAAACLSFLVHRLTPLHPPPADGCVVITGASRGLGADAAVRLCAAGFTVFAGCRSQADGARLRLRCRQQARQGGGELLPLLLDVTDEQQVQQAVETVRSVCEQRGWRLFALIHNAGHGQYAPLEMLSVERLRLQYEVNVIAPHRLTLCFLPLLRRSADIAKAARSSAGARLLLCPSPSSLPPRLLFVTSVTARLTVAGRGAYGSSKRALLSLCDCWRQELRAFGIAVVEVCPGELLSAFHRRSADNYAQIMRECTVRALQQAGGAAAASPPACPPPLPLSVLNHYDRAYAACSRRWRVVGSADMSSDAIYDCGDDAAVSSIVRLLPTSCLDWMLGRWFARFTKTADDEREGEDEPQQQLDGSRATGEAPVGAEETQQMIAAAERGEAERSSSGSNSSLTVGVA
jgi:NAD(P)-dependent dehydrogenase (short-subunit alcohol dehydrogenase family)